MSALLTGAITPWLEPKDEPSVVPAKWEWTAFDLTKPQKYTGVIKSATYTHEAPLATAKIEIAGKTYDVMLGPPVRLDFRGLEEEDFQVGKMITFEAVASKQNPNELRVQTFTKGNNVIDAR